MTDLRPLTAAELPVAHTALELAFGSDPHPATQAVECALLDPANSLSAWDGADCVATAGWLDLEMALPGAVAPVGFVTWVGVSPTHRRQGLLTAMMTRQLRELRDAGRAVAALWASEGAIYQRFGYGCASWQYALDVARGAAFARPVDTSGLRLAVPTQELLQPVYDGLLPRRPGWCSRPSDAWWTYRLHDPEHRRDGFSALRVLLDGPDGYALFRTRDDGDWSGLNGTVRVTEVAARTPTSEARLWRFLLDQDLMTRTTAACQPVDSPLLQLLLDPRQAKAVRSDGLWVRLTDVGAALAQRSRATDDDVVVEVVDGLLPENAGAWHLDGSPTSAPADLRLDVRDLGAAYLGGTSLQERATAGWVEELTPGAVAAASRALSWPGRVAHSPLVF